MTKIKEPVTWTFRLIGYSIVLLITYLGVATVSDFYVRDRASKFCRSIFEGYTAGSIAEGALEAGAALPDQAWRASQDSTQRLIAKFPGLSPFDGYACTVMAKNNQVLSAEFSELSKPIDNYTSD